MMIKLVLEYPLHPLSWIEHEWQKKGFVDKALLNLIENGSI